MWGNTARLNSRGILCSATLARLRNGMEWQVKASILDAKTQLNKATQLNFGLTGKTASAKKHTQMERH